MIAEIVREYFVAPQGNGIKATLLSNNYFVSTTKLSPLTKLMDAAISAGMKKCGVTPEDLERPGHLDMPGDYETMVFEWFPDEGHRGSQEVGFARYETREEAEKGHEEMVERWRRMPPPHEEE